MNKKIALSVGMLLFVGAIVVGATGAFFSDTETSTGNTFTAGALDLKVDNTCHYFQDGVDVGCEDGNQVTQENWAQTDLLPGVHKFFNFDDVKPGDHGESTISLHVYDNDAWGRFVVNKVDDSDLDNSCTEPEGVAENAPLCDPDGELDEAMTTTIWLDEGAIPGFQNAGPDGIVVDTDPITQGVQPADPTEGDNILQATTTVQGDEEDVVVVVEPILGSGLPFFDTSYNLWTVLAAARTAHAACAAAPVNGHVNGSGLVQYGPCNGLAVDGRMGSSTTYYIGWKWDLPSTVGNEVQTDSISGDVQFDVVQHRNNPGKAPLLTQCSDGIDNDVDTFIDLADAQCADLADNDETI